jgi:type II secretion system protein N
MKTRNQILLYTLYGLFIAVVFLYVLFPAAAAKTYIEQSINGASTNPRISLGRVKPSLPPGLKMLGAEVLYSGQALVRCSVLTMAPKYLSFIRGRPSFSLKGRLHGGTLKGSLSFEKIAPPGDLKLEVRLDDVATQKMMLVKLMTGQKISAKLNADIVYENGPAKNAANMNLALKDVDVALKAPVMGLKRLIYETVQADVTSIPGGLRIADVKAAGDQMESRLRGSVTFREPTEKSLLQMKGTVKFHLKTISKLDQRSAAGARAAMQSGDGSLPLTITGTLAEPRFKLN